MSLKYRLIQKSFLVLPQRSEDETLLSRAINWTLTAACLSPVIKKQESIQAMFQGDFIRFLLAAKNPNICRYCKIHPQRVKSNFPCFFVFVFILYVLTEQSKSKVRIVCTDPPLVCSVVYFVKSTAHCVQCVHCCMLLKSYHNRTSVHL